MAKKTKEYKHCEYCDRAWENVSPPAKDQYNRAMIHIDVGSVLMPDSLVKKLGKKIKREKLTIAQTHAAGLCGWYCDVYCFTNHVLSILQQDIKFQNYDDPQFSGEESKEFWETMNNAYDIESLQDALCHMAVQLQNFEGAVRKKLKM